MTFASRHVFNGVAMTVGIFAVALLLTWLAGPMTVTRFMLWAWVVYLLLVGLGVLALSLRTRPTVARRWTVDTANEIEAAYWVVDDGGF